MKNEIPELCCPRFKRCVKEGLIEYSYSDYDEIDETSWYVPDFVHLYYCPFCGAHIKGRGWGEYDETRKPDIELGDKN